MIRRGTNQSVYRLVVQDVAKVFDCLRCCIEAITELLGGTCESSIIDIAQIGNFHVVDFGKVLGQIHTATEPHHTDPDRPRFLSSSILMCG